MDALQNKPAVPQGAVAAATAEQEGGEGGLLEEEEAVEEAGAMEKRWGLRRPHQMQVGCQAASGCECPAEAYVDDWEAGIPSPMQS